MRTSLQPQRSTAFWPRLWDRLVILEDTLSTTPEELRDRRITQLEIELATVRKELALLRVQGPQDVILSERGQA